MIDTLTPTAVPDADEATLTIGKLALATDTSVETVRYYERIGLMPAPPRTPSGYRMYSATSVERLRFIRHARELEFSLAEVGRLLRHRDGVPDCGEIAEITARRAASIGEELERLNRAYDDLAALRERCDGQTDGDACGFLEAMERPVTV